MFDIQEKEIKKKLFILIAAATAIRLFIAATLEFSVDEVYYWTYALYPDWSHFDHPPMVGWVIQLFSLNLFFESELAVRLGAIVFSIFNTLIIYEIGKMVKNPLAGLYAAFLLNASVYCSVLAGSFILPDSPQLLFWLLSLKYLIMALPSRNITPKISRKFLLASLFVGLAIIAKYHGVFIWAGIGLYVLFFNRRWLKMPSFYGGMVLSAIFVIPIVIWNIENNWISFTFHGDRVASALVIRPDYLLTEIFGQVAYNNPVNYVLILLSLIAIFKGKLKIDRDHLWILLLNSMPIWLVFTSFALFRSTLPHWTGPAFTSLIVLASVHLADKPPKSSKTRSLILFPKAIRASVYLLTVLLFLAWALINYYPGTIGKTANISRYGDTDFTLDMYGWNQIKNGFELIHKANVATGKLGYETAIISPKYFPGTEIDYYVARPLNMKLLQYGTLSEIHKYAWINEERGQLRKGDNAYMISTSNWYKDPYEYYGKNFEDINPSDTIKVFRSGELAYFAFVYELKNYKGNFADPFAKK
jgi:4-amino-4-deoxy-L-arabinose transferase-like glycosyltransferase